MYSQLQLRYGLDWQCEVFGRDPNLPAGFISELDRWFISATQDPTFRDRPYLLCAMYTSYYKMNKVRRAVEEVESFALLRGLERSKVHILDAGCGRGTFSFAFGISGYHVTSIDSTEGYLGYARRKAGDLGLTRQLDFHAAEAVQYLDSHPHQFDVVLAMDVMEHLRSPRSFCQSAFASLKRPGLLVVIVPAGWSLVELAYLAPIRLVERLRGLQKPEGTHHIQKFSLRAIRKLIEDTGFTYKFISSIYSAVPPLAFLLLGGPRSRLVALNMKLAATLPRWMGSSWLIIGLIE